MSACPSCVQTPAAASNSASVEANGRCVSMPADPARRAAAAQQRGARLVDRQRVEDGVRLGQPRVPHSRRRLTPPSGKMFSRTCVTATCAASSVVKKCRVSAASFVSGRSGVQRLAGDQVGDPRAGRVDALERAAIRVVALEVVGVDLDACRSCRGRRAGPGSSRARAPRLRRVSQPPPMFSARPGSSRLFIGPKKASEQASASPPLLTAARSTLPVDGVRARLAIERRRRPLGGDPSVDAEARDAAVGEDVEAHVRDRRAPASPRTGSARRAGAAICGSSSLHSMACSAVERRAPRRVAAPSIDANAGLVADEVVRVDVEADDRAGRAELQHAPVVAGAALAAALPAVHPLAAVGELALDEDAAPGLDQVVGAGEEVVAGAERLAAEAERGEIDQAGERGSVAAVSLTRPPRCSRARPIGPCRMSVAVVDLVPADERPVHAPAQGRPDVGRDLVTVDAGRPRATVNGVVGIPDDEVGVVARPRSAPCDRCRPASRAGAALIQRGQLDRGARRGAPPRSRPRARPSCSDAMPPQAAMKSPRSAQLQRRRARAVIGDDEVDHAVEQRRATAPRGSRARGSAART